MEHTAQNGTGAEPRRDGQISCTASRRFQPNAASIEAIDQAQQPDNLAGIALTAIRAEGGLSAAVRRVAVGRRSRSQSGLTRGGGTRRPPSPDNSIVITDMGLNTRFNSRIAARP